MTDASDWRGAVGDTWAHEWVRTDRAFADIGDGLDLAIGAAIRAARDGHASGPTSILDVGCGAGASSLGLAAAFPGARITAIDLSTELVAVARGRAADRYGSAGPIEFVVGDAPTEARGRGPFDAIVSRHGLMFFDDPPAAFAALRAAARPGAPLVFSCFRSRAENPWAQGAAAAVVQASLPPAGTAPGPFAFADRAYVAGILAAAGWRQVRPREVDTTFRVGIGADPIADAVDFLGRIGSAASLLRTLPDAGRAAARDRLAAFAARHNTGDAIDFPAAIWIWSAIA